MNDNDYEPFPTTQDHIDRVNALASRPCHMTEVCLMGHWVNIAQRTPPDQHSALECYVITKYSSRPAWARECKPKKSSSKASTLPPGVEPMANPTLSDGPAVWARYLHTYAGRASSISGVQPNAQGEYAVVDLHAHLRITRMAPVVTDGNSTVLRRHYFDAATIMLSQPGRYAAIVQANNVAIQTLAVSEVFHVDQQLLEDSDLFERAIATHFGPMGIRLEEADSMQTWAT